MAGRDRISVTVLWLAGVALVCDALGVVARGVPLSLLPLAVLSALVLLRRRTELRPPSWLHVLLLCCLCLGLTRLGRTDLAAGLRELVQAVVVLGIAWVTFGALGVAERRRLQRVLLGLFVGLVAWHWGTRLLGRPGGTLNPTRFSLLLSLLLPFTVTPLAGRRDSDRCVAGLLLAYAATCMHAGLMLCGVAGAAVAVRLAQPDRARRLFCIGGIAAVLGACVAGSGTWQVLRLHRPETGSLKRLYIEVQASRHAVAASPVVGHGLGRYKDTIQNYFQTFPDPDDNRIVPDTNSQYILWGVEAGLPSALLLAALLVSVMVAAVKGAASAPDGAAAAGMTAVVVCASVFATVVTRNTNLVLGYGLGVAAAAGRPGRAGLAAWLQRLGVAAAAFAVCLGLSLARAPRSPVPDPADPVTGLVVEPRDRRQAEYLLIEAEAAAEAVTAPMLIAGSNDASGNRVLAVPDKAGKGKGHARYQLPDATTGDFVVWVRAHWADGCSNSIGCAVGESRVKLSDEIFKRWHWVAGLQPLRIPAGVTELRLENTEDGVMIDQVLLTRDKRFVPHGIMKQTDTHTADGG